MVRSREHRRSLEALRHLVGCVLVVVALSWLAGCRPWTMPGLVRMPKEIATEKDHETTAAAKQAEALKAAESTPALTQDVWIRTLPSAASATGLRWRSPAMDELLAAPRERQPDFQAVLTSQQPIVAANAAIALAKLGSSAVVEQLVVAICATPLKLPLRRAAVEALSLTSGPQSLTALKELTEQYGRFGPDQPGYLPEMHAELLYALARQIDAAEEPTFTAAVYSPAPDVRLAALEAWTKSKAKSLPIAVADLRGDPDKRVRSAALMALASTHDPQAVRYAALALSDDALEVRLTAIAALGKTGSSEAQPHLEKLLKNDGELIRAATVTSLAEIGADDLVRSAADDKAWRVRLAVVQQLGRSPSRESTNLAQQFLADASSEVQRATVAAVESWPLEQAGPVLLTALEGRGYLLRKAAAAQLSRRWEPAAEYKADLPADRQAEALTALKSTWYAEHSAVDRAALEGKNLASPAVPTTVNQDAARQALAVLADRAAPPEIRAKACAQLKDFGAALLPWLDNRLIEDSAPLADAVYDHVLPELAPEFAAIAQLRSRDVDERRRAADRLARQAAQEPLRRLAVVRMAELAALEPDALVVRSLLSVVAKDNSESARELASAAVSHPSPEIRRLACDYFAAHPRSANIDVLLPALADSYTPVVMSAVRALGEPGVLSDPAPLERLLTAPDRLLRLEAAISLARMHAPDGPAALERLAGDNDQEIRRRTADAMGRLGDPIYTAALITMLDDRSEARRAAVANLPLVVGHDVAATTGAGELSLVEKIERWKHWWELEKIHSEPSAKALPVAPLDR